MEGIKIREIEEGDLFNGFLESLDSLRKASTIDKSKAVKILRQILSSSNHYIFVAILNQKVIGSITLLVENKFIHDGGLVGHIEDVVVNKEYQGQKTGEQLVKYALDYSKERGCYKTILDCDDDVKPFYEKLGFKKHSHAMRFDHV